MPAGDPSIRKVPWHRVVQPRFARILRKDGTDNDDPLIPRGARLLCRVCGLKWPGEDPPEECPACGTAHVVLPLHASDSDLRV